MGLQIFHPFFMKVGVKYQFRDEVKNKLPQ